MADPAIARGVGRYKIVSDGEKSSHRETDAFELEGDRRAWNDGRVLVCQHQRRNTECGVQTKLLSNDAFEEERNRLLTQNGALDGPCCGNCGTAYLEAPEEFIFNGANGRPSRKVGHKKGSEPRARSVRIVHKPCKGLPGARFTVSSEHRRQKKRDENIQILSLIANGAGMHDMRCILRGPRGEIEPGMSRLYDRVFWLEPRRHSQESRGSNAASIRAWDGKHDPRSTPAPRPRAPHHARDANGGAGSCQNQERGHHKFRRGRSCRRTDYREGAG